MSLTTAIAAHYEGLLRREGIPAVLSRGSKSCELTIVLLGIDQEKNSTRDVQFVAGMQDILTRAVDYAPRFAEPLGESITAPEAGDRFVFEDGGERLTCEVRSRSASQGLAKELHGRQYRRVYTKILERERV